MIVPTQLHYDKYRTAQRLESWIYEIPSLGIGAESDDIILNIGVKEGSIAVVRVACSSTDFNISIRTKPEVLSPSVYEVYQVLSIDKSYNEVMSPKIIFSNSEEPETENLYLVIKNNDTVVTGIITLELVISRM